MDIIGDKQNMLMDNKYCRAILLVSIYILFIFAIIVISIINISLKYSQNIMTTWILPSGILVRHYKQRDPFDALSKYKFLDVVKNNKITHVRQFADWHAGYESVELRSNETCSLIWLVDNGYTKGDAPTLGCSIDLRDGSFVDEGGDHPKGVSVNSGRIVPIHKRVNIN